MTLTAPVATHSATDATLPAGLRGYAALLRRDPNARKLWPAQVVLQLGNWFNAIALLGLLVEPTGMLCAGVAHRGNAWAMTLSGLIVQAHTPDYVRGRVMALDNVGWAVVSALSNLIVASVAVRFTPQAGVLAAVALTVVSVIGWLIAMRRMPAR